MNLVPIFLTVLQFVGKHNNMGSVLADHINSCGPRVTALYNLQLIFFASKHEKEN